MVSSFAWDAAIAFIQKVNSDYGNKSEEGNFKDTTFSYIGAVRGIWMLAEEKQKYLLVANVFGGTGCYPYICFEIYLINIQ